MPNGRSTRKKRNRKVYHIKTGSRRKSRPFQSISFQGFIMPKRYYVKMRYIERATLDPGVDSAVSHVMNAQSTYDPSVTYVGHQPRGRDQLFGFYNHCTTLGSRITCKFLTGGSSPAGQTIVGIRKQADTTTQVLVNDMLEKRNTTYTTLGWGGAGLKTLTMNYSTKKFLGVKDPLDEERLRESASVGPTESAYFVVFAAPPDTTSDPGILDVVVQIDYIVCFSEPKQLAQS